jgi:hypothetical protein
MLFNRVSQSGYIVAATDLCQGGIDIVTAQVSKPKRYLKFDTVIRSGTTPTGTLEMLSYFPYEGFVVAYTSPSVARVEWIGPNGGRLDAMSPVHGWTVLEGIMWPMDVRADVGPQVGTLVALDHSGKRMASLEINSQDAVPPHIGGATPLAQPCPT